MGIEEQLGEIVIAPRVLEKIIAIATAKVDGVHSFSNKSVSDTLSKLSLGRVSLYKLSVRQAIFKKGQWRADKFSANSLTMRTP